jgi:proteic killer suppression protein
LTNGTLFITYWVIKMAASGLPEREFMEIATKDPGLKAALEDEAVCKRDYGTDTAKKIKLRHAELRAAETLEDFWPPKSGPGRCHELVGDLAGVFSIDLNQPYRLLFKPIEENPPKDRSNEKARWANIKAIDILRIEDTHG